MKKVETRIFEANFKSDKERLKAYAEVNKKVSEFLSFFGDRLFDYNVTKHVYSFKDDTIVSAMVILRHSTEPTSEGGW